MGLSNKALRAIAARYYLPYGCGVDRDDLVQEATIAVAFKAEGKGNGYARRTAHNEIGMLIERERAQKRLPPEGYKVMPEGFAPTHGHVRDARRHTSDGVGVDGRVDGRVDMAAPDNTTEEEVYVAEVLGALGPTSREVIRLRMDPRAMLGYYERADKPIPTVASYADIAGHLGVSIAAVMRAIDEARAIVLADA